MIGFEFGIEFRRLVNELDAGSLRNFLQVEAVPRQRGLRVGA